MLIESICAQLRDKSAPILNIGCGEGIIYSALRAELGTLLNYIGVDCDRACLAKARMAYPKARISLWDGKHIPYRDKTFDIVLLNLKNCTLDSTTEAARLSSRLVIVYDESDEVTYTRGVSFPSHDNL